jgi:phage shock protein C
MADNPSVTVITVMARFWPLGASRLLGAVLPIKLWLL